jgi:hypothetical protein
MSSDVWDGTTEAWRRLDQARSGVARTERIRRVCETRGSWGCDEPPQQQGQHDGSMPAVPGCRPGVSNRLGYRKRPDRIPWWTRPKAGRKPERFGLEPYGSGVVYPSNRGYSPTPAIQQHHKKGWKRGEIREPSSHSPEPVMPNAVLSRGACWGLGQARFGPSQAQRMKPRGSCLGLWPKPLGNRNIRKRTFYRLGASYRR